MTTNTTTAQDTVQAWLSSRITSYGKRAELGFDPDMDFAEIGLDSVYALTLCGDIEDQYGLEVDPEIMWDYPTIRTLAAELVDLGAH